MKRITTLLTFTLLLSCIVSFAQHQHSERCGHVQVMQNMEAKFPGYIEAVNKTFEEAKIKGKRTFTEGRREVYTLPVIIHILHREGTNDQNLPDSMIEDQIRILNEDFRLLNADAGNIRTEFADLQGDAMLQFEVKQIIRKQHNRPLGFAPPLIPGLGDGIKDPNSGGSAAVDPEHNINIWIGELIGGIVLGYAFPPANLPNWPAGTAPTDINFDGVVLDYRAFASNNPASSFYENNGFEIVGRTATHELGHYLGLRHYWGDGACADDDGIEDTPAAADNSQASGCDTTKNTCDDGENDLPDMWENYMDYSQETCQVAFTPGQIELMTGVVEVPRVELTRCEAPTTASISGNTNVEPMATESYSVSSTGNTFLYTVVGGEITAGYGTNTIEVTWNDGITSGQVCLVEAQGLCDGTEECITVTVNGSCSAPTTGTISGASNADVATTETYSVPATGNTYTWSVVGGTGSSTTNSIDVTWGTGISGQVCLTEADGACIGNEECFDVTLNTPTGIEEIAYAKALSVYPSPATSYINVTANEVPTRIELIDLLGSVLSSYESLQLDNSLVINDINTKVVLVKVYFEEGFAVRSVIIE